MTLMLNALPEIREPENSPFIGFERGSKERTLLVKEIENIRASDPEVLPLWIGGPRHTLENTKPCIVPHDQNRTLAFYSIASKKHVEEAIETVLNAREAWSQIPWPMRLNIFQTAARLLEKKYLYEVVAAVMEDYSKNPYEAFIDVQELIDFWNFNCWYASTIYREQPKSNADTSTMLDYLPLGRFL